MASHILVAQKPGPPPGGGNNPGTPTGRTPNTTPNRTIPSTIDNSTRNIYITGNVILDDGTPPPQPVTIERICNNTARAQGYTDTKGRFSFQLGDTSGVLQDATQRGSSDPLAARQITTNTGAGGINPRLGNGSDIRLDGCELRAVLAGFRSDTVSLAGRRLMDDPKVGTIVLHRLGEVEGTAVSVTTLQAPKDARRAYEKGRQYLRKNNLTDAADEYLKAVKIYPKYAEAWYELGMLQALNKDTERCRESFTKAMEADAKFVNPYIPLIELAAMDENWTEVVDFSTRLLKLDPVDYPIAYFYQATANVKLGQYEIAEKSARAGEKMDTTHRYPKLEQILAVILAHKKEYAGAIEHLRAYLLYAPDASDAERMKTEVVRLERLAGSAQEANAARKEDAAADQ